MGGKCGEQPGLVVVGDDDLVVGADALIIDQSAEKLDARDLTRALSPRMMLP